MKGLSLFFVVGFTTLAFAVAAEVIESLKTRDGREYLKVEIVESDEIGLKIRHEAGTARIPFERLPDDLRTKYHFDPDKAAAQKARENQDQLQHDRSIADPSAPPAVKMASAAPKVETGNGMEFAPAADDLEFEKLEAYIVSMKLKVETAHKKSAEFRRLAQTEKSRTRSVNQGVDPRGHRLPPKEVADRVGWAKAKRFEAEAEAIDLQVAKARVTDWNGRGKILAIEWP